MTLHKNRFHSTPGAAALAVLPMTCFLVGCEALQHEDAAPAASSLQVQVGIGERGMFQPARDGETLRLQRGCQGSQHIFTSLHIQPVAPGPLQVSVTVLRQADAAVVSTPLSLRLASEPTSDPQAVQITGLTPVIEVPRDVLGREVLIRAQVEASDGARGEGQLRGTVEWGLDSCGGHG